MRNLAFALLVLAAPLSGTFAARVQPPGPPRLARSDEAQLRQMVADMESAWKRRDAAAYAAQFTSDADHVNAYGMWWRGRPEIASSMRFVLDKIYPDNPIRADQVMVQPLGRDVALVRYRWSLDSYSDPDGTRHDNPQGRISQVVVRGASGWKIQSFQSTFINRKVRQVR